jgi:hypothetical protein
MKDKKDKEKEKEVKFWTPFCQFFTLNPFPKFICLILAIVVWWTLKPYASQDTTFLRNEIRRSHP